MVAKSALLATVIGLNSVVRCWKEAIHKANAIPGGYATL